MTEPLRTGDSGVSKGGEYSLREDRDAVVRKLLAVALAILALASAAASARSTSTSVTLATSGRVIALAADGHRAAVIVSKHRGGAQLLVWEPVHRRVVPIHNIFDPGSVALADIRVGRYEASAGNTLETSVSSATLARRSAVELGAGAWDWSEGTGGSEAFGPAGDGRLLAFTIQVHCGDPEAYGEPPCPPGRQTDDVVSATVWRVARHGRCPADFPRGHCARVAKANGELSVLAVDAGRIAARTDHGVRLLTGRGERLRDFPVTKARAAALSGNRLALRVPGAVEIYDAGSGKLIRRFDLANARLEDLDGGILVTAMGRTVTLRRLRDGRTATIHTRGIAHAQLEGAGLFVAGGRRVTFTPRRDILRLLGAEGPGR